MRLYCPIRVGDLHGGVRCEAAGGGGGGGGDRVDGLRVAGPARYARPTREGRVDRVYPPAGRCCVMDHAAAAFGSGFEPLWAVKLEDKRGKEMEMEGNWEIRKEK